MIRPDFASLYTAQPLIGRDVFPALYDGQSGVAHRVPFCGVHTASPGVFSALKHPVVQHTPGPYRPKEQHQPPED